MKASVKFYRPVQECLVLIAYASSESLKRRDLHEGSGQVFRASSYNISNMRAVKDLARLHFSAVSPESSLIKLKRRDEDEGSCQILQASPRTIGTNCICEQRIPKKMGCR